LDIQESNGFRWNEADAYLFDIDGTLLLSRDRIHRHALPKAMLEVYGLETTIDGIAYHGKTDPGIIRAALERGGIGPATIDRNMAEALELIRCDAAEQAHRFDPNVLPGVHEVLNLLWRQGKLLGVSSGNLGDLGWLKLKAAGLKHFFAFGCFADDFEWREHIFRKAATEVHQRLGPTATICFVGDTPDDVRAAQAVGGRVIAVGTGIFKVAELAALGADRTVSCCADLLAL
jgi:phosphoglycolate phosphatase